MLKSIVLFSLLSTNLFANSPLSISFIEEKDYFYGSGCRLGEYNVEGKGTNSINVTFKRFDASNPKEESLSKLSKSDCRMVFLVNVAPGYEAVADITWNAVGYGQARLVRGYADGQVAPNFVRSDFTNGIIKSDQYVLRNSFDNCEGGVTTLTVNGRLEANREGSLVSLSNKKNALNIKLRVVPCNPY